MMKRSLLIVTGMLLFIGAHDQVSTDFGNTGHDNGRCQVAACGPGMCGLPATEAAVMSLDFTAAGVAGGSSDGCNRLLLEPIFLMVHEHTSPLEPGLLVRQYRTIPRTA